MPNEQHKDSPDSFSVEPRISQSVSPSSNKKRSRRLRNAIIVVIVGALWLALDIATKRFFGAYESGDIVGQPIGNIIQFRLVHNSGAAWGIFHDMTFILGILAVVVCVLLLIFLFVVYPNSSVGISFGLALVVAGGIGNAIDRFTLGYVIDFIDPIFIDFPVFNVADIGVTCGIVIFLIALIVQWCKRGNANKSDKNDIDQAVSE